MMVQPFPQDVESLIRLQMATGRYPSEADLLRVALLRLAEVDADLQAVEEALHAIDAGDPGTPLDDAIAEIRKQHAQKPI